MSAEPKAAGTASSEASGAEWSLQSPPPEGITLENLRKRGFDLLRVHIRSSGAAHKLMAASLLSAAALALAGGYPTGQWLVAGALGVGLFVLGLALGRRAAPGAWTVTILPDRLSIRDERPGAGKAGDTDLMFSEIQEIRIKKSARRSQNALVLASNTATIVFGAGLSMQALEWLKNYLIMEVSGLTWRPIFDVGRQTTRKRSAGQANILQNRPELARKIRTKFLEHAPNAVEKLRAAVEKKDPVGIKREAHWLKSSGANVGASHFSELCQLMEIYALNNDLSKSGLVLSDIDKEFAKVQAELNDLQGQDAPEGMVTAPPVSLPKYEIKSAPRPGSGTNAQTTSEKAAAIEIVAPAKPAPLFDARVLLVEDSPINQEWALEFLSDLVSYVAVAEDGQQAVDAHLDGKFDMIFMDCQMPEMDGFQATRLIRKRERNLELPPVPIIALTANALRGDRDKCLAAGMDDYISKPFAPETLRATVEKWLGPKKIAPRTDAGGSRPAPAQATVGGP